GHDVLSSLQQHLGAANIAHSIVGEPPLFYVVFHTGPVTDYRSYLEGDDTKARIFNQTMRAQGILKSDSKFYPSLALADEDLRLTDQAIEAAAQALLD
ncbi:MAG: aspartate aminotransferase family protein, partial [Pseudomonadota bacterium]